MSEVFHEVMRGPSEGSVLGDDAVVAVVGDLATAPIGEPLREKLWFLEKVTRDPGHVAADDVTPLTALRVSRAQIDDALNVA